MTTDSSEALRPIIAQVLSAAIRAVDPAAAVKAHVVLEAPDALRVGSKLFRLSEFDHVLVAGAGKAGAPMSAALREILGPRVREGVVNVK